MEKKTYRLIIDGVATNDYIRGRISGMIDVLTGQPEIGYGWCMARGDVHWMTAFSANDEEYKSVIECVEKYYPNAILLVKEKER